MQQLVTAAALADALNRLRLADPMWEEGGFRVMGRWLEIDPIASDELAACLLGCDLEEARARNDAEARWLVAGGVAVVYSDRRGWQPAPPVLPNGTSPPAAIPDIPARAMPLAPTLRGQASDAEDLIAQLDEEFGAADALRAAAGERDSRGARKATRA